MHFRSAAQPAFETPDGDNTELFSRAFSGSPPAAGASSIAPFALDLDPAPRRSRDSLADLERTAGVTRTPASQKRSLLAAAGAIAALSLVSALGLRVPPRPHTLAQPRMPRVAAAHEALLVPVVTAPYKDVREEADATSPAMAAAPRALRRPTSTATRDPQVGFLRVPVSVKGLLVDGVPHRVDRGLLSLPCGTHMIKAPSQPARSVTLACAATTAL